jgi:uroporphyrinogen III methyltransferase/synthase
MEKQKPLEGKTIVTTRARHQSAEFTQRLTDLGARVVPFPTIEIVPPESWAPVDKAIDHIQEYHWIVFTSANGVRCFVERFRERNCPLPELPDIRFCAIGPRTADEMKAEGIEVDLLPGEYRAEAVVESLKKEGVKGKRILLARAKEAREVLPRELKKLGARVDTVPVYQTVRPKGDIHEILRLLEDRRIDAMTFTSSSTVRNFIKIFSGHREKLLRGLENVAVAVIGPITEETARSLGLRVDISAREYTIPALTDAIVEYFISNQAP